MSRSIFYPTMSQGRSKEPKTRRRQDRRLQERQEYRKREQNSDKGPRSIIKPRHTRHHSPSSYRPSGCQLLIFPTSVFSFSFVIAVLAIWKKKYVLLMIRSCSLRRRRPDIYSLSFNSLYSQYFHQAWPQ